MPRKPDRIIVESESGSFDRFSSVQISNDLLGVTEATFEIGDDSAWEKLEPLVAPGKPFRVLLNGQPRLTGRSEVNEVPITAGQGARLNLTVRTKLTDARYRSADEKARVEGASVKQFIISLFAPLGLKEADFVFAPFTARDLMTGKQPPGSPPPPTNLEQWTIDQAKIQPPETIWEAATRHLARYHAAIWDAPDGRIVVGVPDDDQAPLYRLQCKRGAASRGNNVLSVTRIRDWSDVARRVSATAQVTKKGEDEDVVVRIRGEALDAEVDAVAKKTGHFDRQVILAQSKAKDLEHAKALAERELSARRRRKDGFDVLVDGWSYWTGTDQVPWAHNTTADVDVDVLGVEARGRYLVTSVTLSLSVTGGTTAQLGLVAPDIWVV